MMEIKKDRLVGFLSEIDKELGREIRLNTVGGTAMTLLGLKNSTIDVDFDMNEGDRMELERALETIPHGFKVDIFTGGLIFSQQLPEDYLDRLVPIDADFKNIRLFALNPLDIVVTKLGRLDERDMQDIESCIKNRKLKKEAVIRRAGQVGYVGNEENYRLNLQVVLKRFFK